MSGASDWHSAEPECDPEREERQRIADQALSRAALALVAEVRGRDSFPTEPEDAAQLVERIRPRLPGFELSLGAPDAFPENAPLWSDAPDLPDHPRIRIAPDPRACLHLQSQVEASAWVEAYVYADGELAEEGSVSALAIAASPASPGGVDVEAHAGLGELAEQFEREALNAAREAANAAERAMQFEGGVFVRALTGPLKPSAAIQIRSMELYGDGLIVAYLMMPEGNLQEQSFPFGPSGSISVEDDVETNYKSVSADASGLRVIRGTSVFVPAVPDTARELRVKTDAGVVEFSLK